jgi:hypothetical protein
MRSRFDLKAALLVIFPILAAGAASAFAQANPDIFVTPVANAPFSAVVNVQRTVLQADGRWAAFRTLRMIGRDSMGRIHNESRMLEPVTSGDTPQLISIHLYDPATRTSARLDARRGVYWASVVNHPPSTVPPQLLASPTANGLPENQFTREEDLGTRNI